MLALFSSLNTYAGSFAFSFLIFLKFFVQTLRDKST